MDWERDNKNEMDSNDLDDSLVQCEECGHLHFDSRINRYEPCPVCAPDYECPAEQAAGR